MKSPRNVAEVLFLPLLYLNDCPCGSTPVLLRCWIADCSLEWPSSISSDGCSSVAKKSKYVTPIIIRMQQRRSNALMISLHWKVFVNNCILFLHLVKSIHLRFFPSDTFVSFSIKTRLFHFRIKVFNFPTAKTGIFCENEILMFDLTLKDVSWVVIGAKDTKDSLHSTILLEQNREFLHNILL